SDLAQATPLPPPHLAPRFGVAQAPLPGCPGRPYRAAMAEPVVLRTVGDLREQVSAWRRDGARVALVPTMGALHEGHPSLRRMARATGARLIVSIFVNPKQFGPAEDFSAYPRTLDKDIALLTSAGTDAVYAPAAEEIYPEGFATSVRVLGPATDLEGAFRP